MDLETCSCVLLNYNDADTTIALVEEIHSFDLLKNVVVVDNCSTDDSWEKLRLLCRLDKVITLKTDRNGGYGYGNQYGVRYAHDVLGEKLVLIINPDVSFTEEELNFYRDVSINPGSRFKCCNGFCFVHERD